MAFQLSPGINVSEIDLTTIVPSGATSIGAFAGPFAWGPVGEIITISDESKLVDRFGKPDSTNYEYWFSAANFLAYSNNLKIVRSFGSGTKNAVANGTSVLIKNDDDWLDNYSSGASTYGEFAAKYAGAIGNSLKVSLCDANTYSGWAYSSQFTATPATSTYTSNQGGANDEIHIVVVDEDGKFTGTAGTVLEKFGFVSKAADAKDDSGNTIYYKNVLTNKSKYIRWMCHPTANTGASYANASSTWGNNASGTSFSKLSANVTISFGGGTAAGGCAVRPQRSVGDRLSVALCRGHQHGHHVERQTHQQCPVEAHRHRDDGGERTADDGEEAVHGPAPGHEAALGLAVSTGRRNRCVDTGGQEHTEQQPYRQQQGDDHGDSGPLVPGERRSGDRLGDTHVDETHRDERSRCNRKTHVGVSLHGLREPCADRSCDEEREQRHRERQGREAEQQGESLDHRDLDEHEAKSERGEVDEQAAATSHGWVRRVAAAGEAERQPEEDCCDHGVDADQHHQQAQIGRAHV